MLQYCDGADGSNVSKQIHNCITRGKTADCPRAFVMEAADRNLEQIFQCVQQVAVALVSVHDTGATHGDLKLKNVVRTVDSCGNAVLKLIDFDAAVKFGDHAGAKTSTGVCPPELFAKQHPCRMKSDLPACASFGLLLHGKALFSMNRDDNVEGRELRILAQWSTNQTAIAMSRSQIQSNDAKDLLAQLLHPDPVQRPTMNAVLGHAFFQPATIKGMLEDLKKGQASIKTATEQIRANAIELKEMSNATKKQLEENRTVLLRSMFEATGVLVPTSLIMLTEPIQLEGEGSPIEHGGARAKAQLVWPCGSIVRQPQQGRRCEGGGASSESLPWTRCWTRRRCTFTWWTR